MHAANGPFFEFVFKNVFVPRAIHFLFQRVAVQVLSRRVFFFVDLVKHLNVFVAGSMHNFANLARGTGLGTVQGTHSFQNGIRRGGGNRGKRGQSFLLSLLFFLEGSPSVGDPWEEVFGIAQSSKLSARGHVLSQKMGPRSFGLSVCIQCSKFQV